MSFVADGTVPYDAREFYIPAYGLEIGLEKSSQHAGSFLKVVLTSLPSVVQVQNKQRKHKYITLLFEITESSSSTSV